MSCTFDFEMKRRRIIIVALVVLLGISGLGLGTILLIDRIELSEEERSTYALDVDEVKLLRNGDVIMRKGYGMVSRMIATRLEGRYNISHCGIVVERGGMLFVVHTVSSNISDSDGMQAHPLKEFVRQSRPGSIVVNRLCDRGAGDLLAEGALEYLEQAIGFDKNFDINDTTKFYCSEMIWRSLKRKTGIDLYDGLYDEEGAWYSFDHFFNPNYFEVVLNHQEIFPELAAD